jgi:chitodextrinase/beta-glucanase (GH16 family)
MLLQQGPISACRHLQSKMEEGAVLGAAPTFKRRRAILLLFVGVVSITTLLLVSANTSAKARAATSRPTTFWGVALDGRQPDQPDPELLAEVAGAGVRAIVTDPRRWSPARHERLLATVRKLGMILIEPRRAPTSPGAARTLRTRCHADNGTLRRCALVATSVREAAALEHRGTVDFVVVRLASPTDFQSLRSDSSKRTRVIGILTVGDSPALDGSLEGAITAAADNPKTTLAVGLSGPAAAVAMHSYLGEVAKHRASQGAPVAERSSRNQGRDTLPPSAPLGFGATNVTQTSVLLRWTASTDNKRVVGYSIYVNGSRIGSTRNTSYSVNGLACGSAYRFSVEAFDRSGNRSVKTSVTTSTASCAPPPGDTQPPTMPGNLHAAAATGTSITVAWNASTDNVAVTGYGEYRNGVLAGSATTLTYTFSGLACGTGYTLAVEAYDAAGNRSPRAAITAATGACAPPADTEAPTMPGNLHSTAATATSITVAWNASTDNVGVTGYGLYNGSSSTGSTGSTSYTFSGLSCATGYTLAVDAYDAAGNRSGKAAVTVSTSACSPPPPPADTQAPTMPGNLHVTAAMGTSITVAWNASTDNVAVTGYGAYRNGTLTGSATSLTYTFSGLACGTGYTLAVDAYDAAGNRSQPASISASSAACLPPPPPADTQSPTIPSNLRATAATGTSITVAWNASTDNVAVTGYGAYRNGTLTGSATTLTYTFSGLTCGTGYALAVDAYDAAGNRSQQAAITAATGACPPPVDTQAPTTPGNLRSTAATATSITVAWNASTDNVAVTGYGLYNGSSSLGSTASTSYTFSGLACGTGFTLAVDAYDAAGNRSGKATLTASTSACQPPPPPPGNEPGPIAGQGYRKVFGDEFAGLDRSVWDDHIWYDEVPHPNWLNFQTVHDGELDLVSRANDLFGGCTRLCYPMNTVTTLSSGKSFQYGYFEARMRWTKGAGAWPGFWLLSTGWAKTGSCSTPAGELDIFEGQGTEPNVFYGTIHRDSANRCGGDQQNGNNYQPVGADLTAGFHTYAALWTPTQVTWYLDDKQLHSAPTYSTDNQPMFLMLQMWSGGWTSDPNTTTPADLHTEVDWVRVWQK